MGGREVYHIFENLKNINVLLQLSWINSEFLKEEPRHWHFYKNLPRWFLCMTRVGNYQSREHNGKFPIHEKAIHWIPDKIIIILVCLMNVCILCHSCYEAAWIIWDRFHSISHFCSFKFSIDFFISLKSKGLWLLKEKIFLPFYLAN